MTERFTKISTPIKDLVLLERVKMRDDRGFLSRLFCMEDLAPFGWTDPVCQINETGTVQAGTVRGRHFQYPPYTEMKLVTCVQGRVIDVVVDLRRYSPTYLKHFAVELSSINNFSLLIPKGFAHGFQSLTDDVRLLYVHSQKYVAASEGGLHPTDPVLKIKWPMPVINLSNRDSHHALIDDQFKGLNP